MTLSRPTKVVLASGIPLIAILLALFLWKGWWPRRTEAAAPRARQPSQAVLQKYRIEEQYSKWERILREARRFDDVERHVEDLLQIPLDESRSGELTWLYSALAGLDGPRDPKRAAALDEWCHVHPDSHIPWLVRGIFEDAAAWEARGQGWAKDVKKDAWPRYFEQLRKARADLVHSYDVNPNDPSSASELIDVELGLGAKEDQREQWYRRALKAFPGHLGARFKMLNALKEQWGGSPDAMFAFAQQCLEDSEGYPKVGVVLLGAYTEIRNRLQRAARNGEPAPNSPEDTTARLGQGYKTIFSEEGLWKQGRAIYERILDRYPESERWRAAYAHYAFLAGHFDVAAEQMDRIGNSWSMSSSYPTLASYHLERIATYDAVALPVLDRNLDDGKRLLEKVLELDPEDCWALTKMAAVAQRQGDRNHARLYARRALDLHPTDPLDVAEATGALLWGQGQ